MNLCFPYYQVNEHQYFFYVWQSLGSSKLVKSRLRQCNGLKLSLECWRLWVWKPSIMIIARLTSTLVYYLNPLKIKPSIYLFILLKKPYGICEGDIGWNFKILTSLWIHQSGLWSYETHFKGALYMDRLWYSISILVSIRLIEPQPE